MPQYDPSRRDPGRPDNPRRPGDAGQPAGLDPTRDPQRPGPPDQPRDSRTPPPSEIRDDDGPGVTAPSGTADRPSSPDDRGSRPDPL
jgi:hypothetical protein